MATLEKNFTIVIFLEDRVLVSFRWRDLLGKKTLEKL